MNRSKLREIIVKVLYETYIYDSKDINYNLKDLIKEQLETQNDFVNLSLEKIKENQQEIDNIANT